jgi:hypothetical protein
LDATNPSSFAQRDLALQLFKAKHLATLEPNISRASLDAFDSAQLPRKTLALLRIKALTLHLLSHVACMSASGLTNLLDIRLIV